MSDDIRVADTATLLSIIEHGREAGLRELLTYGTRQILDINGYHVLSLARAWHRYDPSTARPLHHRLTAVIKVRRDGTPVVQNLDITPSDWSKLPTAEQVQRSHQVFQELNR